VECFSIEICHGGILGHLMIDLTGWQMPWDLTFVDPNGWVEDRDFTASEWKRKEATWRTVC